MDMPAYVMTAKGPAAVLGRGDSTLQVAYLNSAKLNGPGLMCARCVEALNPGPLEERRCRTCGSATNVLGCQIFEDSEEIPAADAKALRVWRLAVVRSKLSTVGVTAICVVPSGRAGIERATALMTALPGFAIAQPVRLPSGNMAVLEYHLARLPMQGECPTAMTTVWRSEGGLGTLAKGLDPTSGIEPFMLATAFEHMPWPAF